MRTRAWLAAISLFVVVLGAAGCRRYVTRPIYQRPTISSVVAFPTTLGPGDSTLVMVFATDPSGGPLDYDWETSGLIIKGAPQVRYLYSTHSPSMVFYRDPAWPSTASDTVSVACTVRNRGGSDFRRVLIFFQD